MKIHDQNLTGINPGRVAPSEAAAQAERQKPAGGAPGAGGDQVQISDLARSLQLGSADSPERAQHLEKLAQAVQQGRYRVDAAELSHRLVEDALRKQ